MTMGVTVTMTMTVVAQGQKHSDSQPNHFQDIYVESLMVEDVPPDVWGNVKEIPCNEDQNILFDCVWNAMGIETQPYSY